MAAAKSVNLASKLSLDHVDCRGKRVLMRVDYNVPLNKETGQVADAKRIYATVPSIHFIQAQAPRCIILMSHLGRPKGRVKKEMSLRLIMQTLTKALGREVIFLPDLLGEDTKFILHNPPPGSIFLLENLRFHVEEEGKGLDADGKKVKADKDSVRRFREIISSYGDVFINDAFGTAHRAHSSMVGVQLNVRAAGFLLNKELQAFSRALESPKRPMLAIVGGAKVHDKIQLLENMLEKVDEMIIGGGMAFTFKKELEGVKIGDSLYDKKGASIVRSFMAKAKAKGIKVHLPIDYITADRFHQDARVGRATDAEGIPDGWLGLDIGPASTALFCEIVSHAKTVVINGPMGVFEWQPWSDGTRQVVHAMAEITRRGAVTVVCGGDTARAARQFGVANDVTHVSTGGGASLELLEGKVLPGIAALSDVSEAKPASRM